MAEACAVTGTLFSRKTPVNSCSGRVRSAGGGGGGYGRDRGRLYSRRRGVDTARRARGRAPAWALALPGRV
jgi:hypothetical protein